MNTDLHFSSRTDEWATPQQFFDQLDAEFAFTLDPCATPENAKCAHYFTRDDDGLHQDWANERVFMNPPYGRTIGQWVQKAWEASPQGATVVCLLPARTDTSYWHEYCLRGEIRYVRGRMRFGSARHAAPFPSAVVIFRPDDSDDHVYQAMLPNVSVPSHPRPDPQTGLARPAADPNHSPIYSIAEMECVLPKIEIIKASEAPPPPRKLSKSAQVILAALSALKKDEVLRLQPDPGKSMRGLKTAIGRVASSNGFKLETWTDDEDQYLFARITHKP